MKNPNAIVSSDYGPIIINLNDTVIGRFVSQHGYWATTDIALIKQLIDLRLATKPKIVLYDIGANIGTHALAFAKTYLDKILIRAFEPQRQIYNMLCGTIAINGLPNVLCHQNAVCDKTGITLEFSPPDYYSNNNFGGFEMLPAVRSDNESMVKAGLESVTSVAVDDLGESVDFLKIDVEGMEDRVLAGARRTLDLHRPFLFLEILKSDIGGIFEELKRARYVAYQKDTDLLAVPAECRIQIDGIPRVF
ncbi:putative uncharacterized protein [Burkholderiales bacterium GJ-E10]|nr:putative uncharacterized protein [Burkholderiales bacterium GJ-E10]